MHMHKEHSLQSTFIGKDKFKVTVNPNIDYAFIVAFIVILYEINMQFKLNQDSINKQLIERENYLLTSVMSLHYCLKT